MASQATRYAAWYDSFTSSFQQQDQQPSNRSQSSGRCGIMHTFSPPGDLGVSDASSNSSRKRARSEKSSNRYESTYQFDDTGIWKNLRTPDIGFVEHNPASATHSTYRQQPRLATPRHDNASHFEFGVADSDGEVTRRWTSKSTDDGRQTIKLGAVDGETSNRKRARTSSDTTRQDQSWGSYVFNMVGGIAGKVMGLVNVGAFTGFTAGGGQGYEMTASAPRKIVHSQPQWAGTRQGNASRPPLPGQYPEEGLDDDNDSGAEEDTRSAKRQQTTADHDWIVVDNSPHQQLRNSSSNYLHPASPRRPASRVSVRPPQVRRPRVSGGRVTSVSYTGSPQVNNEHRRSASFVTPRSPSSAFDQLPVTPPKAIIDADLAKYSAKKLREVRQSDASMSRLNSQLQAMIKQGKQALASTIEVQDDGDVDDDDELVYEGFGRPLDYETYMR